MPPQPARGLPFIHGKPIAGSAGALLEPERPRGSGSSIDDCIVASNLLACLLRPTNSRGARYHLIRYVIEEWSRKVADAAERITRSRIVIVVVLALLL